MITYPLSRAANFGAVKNAELISADETYSLSDNITFDQYDAVISPYKQITNVINLYSDELGKYESALQLKFESSTAVIGAFEYLSDVRPLGRKIRESLIENKKVEVFFGFEGGYYSWSQEALTAFFESLGLQVAECVAVEGKIKKLNIECTQAFYEQYLTCIGIPKPTFGHLIVTTEHSGYRVTGGIGSYVKECDSLYGDDVAILIVDNNQTLDYDKLSQNKWLAPQLFLGKERVQTILESNYDTIGDIVQETLECVVALYSQIESIESQEMLLYRAINAKKLSMIPQAIRLMTVCHGSSLHLAKAKRSVLEAENIHVAYREKFTIENSDTVILPTEYLRKSYIESGISGLDDTSRIIKRLPFDLSRLPEGKALSKYTRLLYIGKTSTVKGFDLFLQTLMELNEKYPEIHDQIDEVVVMATSAEITESYLKDLYESVVQHYRISITSLDREALLSTLAEYSDSTLGLITYRGDNHPLTVLELMAVGVDFIAAEAAGTPELILPGYETHNLAPAMAEEFSESVYSSLKDVKKRSKRVAKLRQDYHTQQDLINTSYSLGYIREMPSMTKTKTEGSQDPFIEIKIEGSSDSVEYKSTLSSIDNQSYPNIKLTKRLGTGQNYSMRLFAGDVLYPGAVTDMIHLMKANGADAVVTDVITMSYEGDGRRKGFEEFHPYPPQLGSVFLQEKYNRRLVGLFKRVVLDDTYTDWQKCIAITAGQGRVTVVPKVSMRLIEVPGYFTNDTVGLSVKWSHAFNSLPVFDASILYSELKRFDDIYWGLKLIGHLEQHFVPKSQELPVISPKIFRVVGAYERFTPRLVKTGISFFAEAVFGVLRQIKRVIKG